MSSKDFLSKIAVQMGKAPTAFQQYVDVLEENFLDTVDSLRDVSEEQWKNDLKFPVGLLNKIKKELSTSDTPMTSQVAPV